MDTKLAADESIGDRIRCLRAGLMSQTELAEVAGVSVDLIRKLEQGQRHTASISSLHRIARALDVDTAELLAKATPVPPGDPEAGVVAIRRVLTGVGDLLAEPDADGEPIDLAEAGRTVTYAWGCYWSGKYKELARLLPDALSRLDAIERTVRASQRARAAEHLAAAYQITGCTLVHLGYPDPAFISLRAALDAAARGGDELRSATLRGSLSWLLLTQGRYPEATRLATASAARIEPTGSVAPARLSVWGSLLLTAATAAGRDRREGAAADMLCVAREAADRIGVDRNDYETAFGPSQVTMQTVDVHVVTEQFDEALTAAKAMPRDAGLPLAARARHLIDVAAAQGRLGRDERALDTLHTVEQAAPDWIQHQTLARQVVRELLDRERRRTRASELRELARRLGVTASV